MVVQNYLRRSQPDLSQTAGVLVLAIVAAADRAGAGVARPRAAPVAEVSEYPALPGVPSLRGGG
ncbi:elongation factor Ts [Mycobacterium sp. PO1]|nr:elongation factor Ts [Mycobacterium sp. PO1]GFM24815.1 elongation factor Ts [Mycobacterium sp. PO2]